MSSYTIQVGQEKYRVEVEDVTAHPVRVTIGDHQFEVWIEQEDGPLPGSTESVPGHAPTAHPSPPVHAIPDPHAVAAQPRHQATGGKMVRAPMPGQILQISVAAGDPVERGDLLCVLEAMKMNNQIRATRKGVVAEVLVEIGVQVNYGDPLVRFE